MNASSQEFQPNYDESKIPPYVLPDPLLTASGDRVTSPEQWAARRAETIELFENHVFGRMPAERNVDAKVVRRDPTINDGNTIRYELTVTIHPLKASTTTEPKSLEIHVLADVPKQPDSGGDEGQISSGPYPAFLGLNFHGNHTVSPDPSIRIPSSWVPDRGSQTTDGHRATERGRGVAASRWPNRMINGAGYAVITAYCGDIDPDFDDGFQNGLHALMPDYVESLPPDQRPGTIAAWSYGLSCILDAVTATEELNIDASNVALIGHSRLGKTSLWAGATDTRFAAVISNNSGCGGAALSRRAFGETVARINRNFPHWFCEGFHHYDQRESELPVDSHQLLAMAAPRPIAVGSAVDDQWADPRGEFLASLHASPVYEVLGLAGLKDEENQTPSDLPVVDDAFTSGTISYHLRTGKHDLKESDWMRYIQFLDRFLK